MGEDKSAANLGYRVVQVGPPNITLWDTEPSALEALNVDLVLEIATKEEMVLQALKDCDAVLAWGASPITRRVMEAMHRCVIIARYGVGVDSVDLEAATEHGIVVTNVPDYCIQEVSNHALLLLLACNQKLMVFHNALCDGRWDHSLLDGIGRLEEQTLGVVGFGQIGRELARKALALGLKVLAYDPYLSNAGVEEVGATPSDFTSLLETADYLSLHVPLNDKTRHMIGEAELRMMKTTAVLVNTSRGPVVDEGALCQALLEGWIAGAGLDVFEKEPISSDNKLIKMENVVLTPHIADYSDASRAEVRRKAAEAVARSLSGSHPINVVNHEVLGQARIDKGMT